MGKKQKKSAKRQTAVQKQDFFDALSTSTQTGICLGAFVLLSLAFFQAFHFDGKTIVASDTVNWRASAESIKQHEAETGRPALWATHIFSGMPAYMISYPTRVPQVDSVAKWIRKSAWPSSHFILLLVGTYLLALFLTRDRLAAVVASVGFGLTTYIPIIIVAGHNSKFVSLCYAPWLLLAFAYVLKRPTLLSSMLFAAVAAVVLRAGHVQIVYYFVFVALVWWVAEGVSAYRNGTSTAFVRATGYLVLGSVLAVLMVAQPYLAHAEYKAYSIRGASAGGAAGGLAWDYAMTWSQGPAELITLFIADSFGGGSHYWGPKPGTAGPHYVGAIVVLFAIIGIVRDRRPATIGLAIAALLMSFFSLGRHLPILNRPMFEYFPLFDAFRAPETWLSAVACVLAVLAAIGVRAVAQMGQGSPAAWKRVLAAAGGVGLLVALLFALKTTLFAFEKPGEFERVATQVARSEQVPVSDPRVQQATRQFLERYRTERIEKFDDDAFRAFAMIGLAIVCLLLFRAGKILPSLLKIVLLLLVTVDLFGVARRYLNDDVMIDRSAVDRQVVRYDFDDFIVKQVEDAGGPGHFRVLSLESDPTVNARPSYFYESVGGYHGAKLRNYQDFLDNVLFADSFVRPNRAALNILGVRYIVAGQELTGFQSVFRGPQTGVHVLENTDVSDRSFLAEETINVASSQEAWEVMRGPDFDAFRTAILREDLALAPAPIDSTSIAAVELLDFGANEIRWEVETDVERMFVASEIYYPKGWTAELNGSTVSIHEVNTILRGVVVPQGKHEIVMRFEPRSDRVGVLLAGTTTAAVYITILVLVGLAWRKQRASPTT